MAYLRKTVGKRKFHRKNGYPNDVCSPDGGVEYGWRLVRKDGAILFSNNKWKDDSLLPFVGQYVVAVVGDYWVGHIDIYTEYPSGDWRDTHLCRLLA